MKKYSLVLLMLLFFGFTVELLAQEGSGSDDRADHYLNEALIYRNNSSFDTAIHYFEKASELYLNDLRWRDYLSCETELSNLYFEYLQNFPEAKQVLKKAIEKSLHEFTEPDTLLSNAYSILGMEYYYLSNYDSILICWNEALKINIGVFGENHLTSSALLNNIGIILNALGRYEEALETSLKDLRILMKNYGEYSLEISKNYLNTGNIYVNLHKFDSANYYYRKSLNIRLKEFEEEGEDIANVYNTLGTMFVTMEDDDSALYYNKLALPIYENAGGNSENLAICYNNFGNIYASQGQPDLAIQNYTRFLNISKELYGEYYPTVAAAYANIASALEDKGEYHKAIENHQMALKLNTGIYGAGHYTVAIVMQNIGVVYDQMAMEDSAMLYYMDALKIYSETYGEDHYYNAQIYNLIGGSYQDYGKYDFANHYYQLAMKIYKKWGITKATNVAITLNNTASYHKKMGDYDLALKYYQRSLTASLRNYNDTSDVHDVPQVEGYLNYIYLLQTFRARAKAYRELSYEVKPAESKKYLELALLNLMAGDTLLNSVRGGMKRKSDKLSLGLYMNAVYASAVDMCLELAELSSSEERENYQEKAFIYSEKNKAAILLEALAGAEAKKFAGLPDSLLRKERQLQIEISVYKRMIEESEGETQKGEFSDQLFDLQDKYDRLITLFESSYPRYYELKYGALELSVKDIQEKLDKNTTVLSYFTSDSSLYVYIIDNKNFSVEKKKKITSLDSIITEYRRGLTLPNSYRYSLKYKEMGHDLYQQLIPVLPGKNTEKLIIIPEGELCLLPFETLLSSPSGDKSWTDLDYMLKAYEISYSYSVNLFYKTLEKQNSGIKVSSLNDWLAFAPVFDDQDVSGLTLRTRNFLEDPGFSSDDSLSSGTRFLKDGLISPLPGTRKEVEEIFEQFESQGKRAMVKIKQNANEEFIKSPELGAYKYLHFATHGFVNTEKPELSGILLAQDSTIKEDGVLFSGELYNLELNALLTVLSACETGLGTIVRGEGLIGLTRALLYAGSKNIIVSLWKVADQSTSELMISLYAAINESKKDPGSFAKALRSAKIEMIDGGKYAHPYYWSPFILIGK